MPDEGSPGELARRDSVARTVWRKAPLCERFAKLQLGGVKRVPHEERALESGSMRDSVARTIREVRRLNPPIPRHADRGNFQLSVSSLSIRILRMNVGNLLESTLEPVSRSLNAEAAGKLLRLKASAALQRRMDELAAKCGEGVASGDELAEYDSMIQAGNLLAILQADARKLLSKPET